MKPTDFLKEDASGLNIGDPVIITGKVQFQGKTGDIVDFGKDKRFVIVNLYNYGKHSFNASDVSYNDYADSDQEEADAYDRDSQARDWMHRQEVGEAKTDKKTGTIFVGQLKGTDPASKAHARLVGEAKSLQSKFEKHLAKHGYDVAEKGRYWEQKLKDIDAQIKAWDAEMERRKQDKEMKSKEITQENWVKFGDVYAEQLAKKVFDERPQFSTKGRADELIDYAWRFAVQDLGKNRARYEFNYDEDFLSDFVSAYGWLQRGGNAETGEDGQVAEGSELTVGIEAYGVRGANSKKWRKKFKSQAAFEKWLDANEGDIEVLGTREVNLNDMFEQGVAEGEEKHSDTAQLLAKLAKVVRSVRTPEQYAAVKKYARLMFDKLKMPYYGSFADKDMAAMDSLMNSINSELRTKRRELGLGSSMPYGHEFTMGEGVAEGQPEDANFTKWMRQNYPDAAKSAETYAQAKKHYAQHLRQKYKDHPAYKEGVAEEQEDMEEGFNRNAALDSRKRAAASAKQYLELSKNPSKTPEQQAFFRRQYEKIVANHNLSPGELKEQVKEGGIGKTHISPSGVKTNMPPTDDDYDINYGKNGLVAKDRKARGVDVKTGKKQGVTEDAHRQAAKEIHDNLFQGNLNAVDEKNFIRSVLKAHGLTPADALQVINLVRKLGYAGNKFKQQGVAEGTDGTADYTLGYPVDKEYVYTIVRNGKPDGGTYHSLEQAKRILGNMKKGRTPGFDQFKITRKPRSKMAGPQGVLPEEYDPSYDPDYRPYEKPEQDPDAWKQERDLEEPATSPSTVTVRDAEGNVVLQFPSTGGYYGDVRTAKAKGFDTEAGDYQMNWQKNEDSCMAEDSGVTSEQVASEIVRRIIFKHKDAITQFGPEAIMAAAREVGEYFAGWEELGTSDIGVATKYTLEKLDQMSRGELDESASGGATGAGAVATTPAGGAGKNVGTLFGGTYKQKRTKKSPGTK